MPGAHAFSLSIAELNVSEARVELDLRFQVPSLIETVPPVDPDFDGRLSAAELRAAEPTIAAYLLAHYRIGVPRDGGTEAWAGELLALAPIEVPDGVPETAVGFEWLGARFAFAPPAGAGPFERLEVESALFVETNPWHQDVATVRWDGVEVGTHLFGDGDTRWVVTRGPPGGAFGAFFRLGIEHILTGWDHLAFLLALLVAARGWRALLGVVTAFTLAHSVTLALAALGVVRLSPGLVEVSIALSIAYVATDNLLRPKARNPWLEAFLFGLLHGLGFAGFLAEALGGVDSIAAPLVAFNLGVETGQVAFVSAVAAPFLVLRRRARGVRDDAAGLVPRRFRVVASSVVATLGLYWFLQRAGWIG